MEKIDWNMILLKSMVSLSLIVMLFLSIKLISANDNQFDTSCGFGDEQVQVSCIPGDIQNSPWSSIFIESINSFIPTGKAVQIGKIKTNRTIIFILFLILFLFAFFMIKKYKKKKVLEN